jgi:hypothetical protein
MIRKDISFSACVPKVMVPMQISLTTIPLVPNRLCCMDAILSGIGRGARPDPTTTGVPIRRTAAIQEGMSPLRRRFFS